MHSEKQPFRYRIPRDPGVCQISPSQIFFAGGIEQGTRNTPSQFAGIYEVNTGDLVVLSELQIPRYGCTVAFMNDYIWVIGGTDATHSPTSSVERMHIAT